MPKYRFMDFDNHWDRERFESRQPASWPHSFSDGLDELETLVQRRSSEPVLQQCFERHPYLLPGIDSLHHGPLAGIIATKFPLGNSFQTDFAFISSNSQDLCITCVEIESARKRLFRKDEAFTRDYIDAKQQISDWVFWAQHNVHQALDCWQPLMRRTWVKLFSISFRAFLVVGRRSELDTPKKRERWASEASSLRPGLITMTYDRLLDRTHYLIPDIDNNKLAVCTYQDRRFKAKAVCA